jgi:hypothetical protein
MDRASQVLAQALPAHLPRTYAALADWGDVPLTTIYRYTATVLRLRGVSDAPPQLACGSPLSAVQRGWQAAWAERAERAEQRPANDNSSQAPSIASTASMLQPPCSSASRQPSRKMLLPTLRPTPHTLWRYPEETRCDGFLTSARRRARRRCLL